MFANSDLYRTTGKNATLMHFHVIVPDIRLPGQQENILTTNYRCFSAVWNYGKLTAKFLVSGIKVIDMWDVCRFLFLEQLLKFLFKVAFHSGKLDFKVFNNVDLNDHNFWCTGLISRKYSFSNSIDNE